MLPVEQCAVCGDDATSNKQYGATTCHSCRVFFHRATKAKKKKSCRLRGLCPINRFTRTQCRGPKNYWAARRVEFKSNCYIISTGRVEAQIRWMIFSAEWQRLGSCFFPPVSFTHGIMRLVKTGRIFNCENMQAPSSINHLQHFSHFSITINI